MGGISKRILGVAGLMLALVPIAGGELARAGGLSEEIVPDTITIPTGPFIAGSDAAEREAAYLLDEAAYGHTITRDRRWYESEPDRGPVVLDQYSISATPITNRQYAAFIAATGRLPPDVDAAVWTGYRLIHPYERMRKFAWTDGAPPAGRESHPVVLASHDDARAYAAWLSRETGQHWRLPTEAEWEKAARGIAGDRFPWGR
jgi:formylglycine-generating enzyme required for sulfatase activity